MPVCRFKFLTLLFLLVFSFEFAFSLNLNKNANGSDLNAVVSDIILQCEISNKNRSKCSNERFIKSNLIKKGIKFDNKTLQRAINFALNSSKFENLNESAPKIYLNSQSKKENSVNQNKNTNSKDKIKIFFSNEYENLSSNATNDLPNTENINSQNNDINGSANKIAPEIFLDFNNIQEIRARSAFSSGGGNKCNQCHDDSSDSYEFEPIVVTANIDDISMRDNIIDIVGMFLMRGKNMKNPSIIRKQIAKNNPKALTYFLQEAHKMQIIDLFENSAEQIYIGNTLYKLKKVTYGPDGAKIFSGVSESKIFQFFRETTGIDKMPEAIKIYENGIFKGNRYTVLTPNGNYTLRDFSTNPAPDGSKFKWTFDVPRELFGKNSGKKTYEIKFE